MIPIQFETDSYGSSPLSVCGVDLDQVYFMLFNKYIEKAKLLFLI